MQKKILLVLAGGFGTRLASISNGCPKILMPIGSQNFLHHQLMFWKHQGFRNIFFLLHHKAKEIEACILSQSQTFGADLDLKSIVEPRPLGTGGAVLHALGQLEENSQVVVVNGDTYIEGDLAPLLSVTSPTLAYFEMKSETRFSEIQIGQNGYVEGISKCTESGELTKVYAGIAAFRASDFSDQNIVQISFEDLVCDRLLHNGVSATKIVGKFTDIGTPASYRSFANKFTRNPKA